MKKSLSISTDYLNGMNTVQLAEKYEITRQSVMYHLTKTNTSRRTRSQAKKVYKVDESYFENIDTDLKAYILGFIVADGCIEECKGENRLSIIISPKDCQILELIKSELKYTGKILKIKANKSTPKGSVALKITSQRLCDTLKKYHVVPRKSFIVKYPDIPKHLNYAFIRGYLDGDGWVSKGRKTILGFVSGSKSMLISIEKIFRETLLLTAKKIYDRTTYFLLQYGAKKDLATIKNFLYANSNFHLERKYLNL